MIQTLGVFSLHLICLWCSALYYCFLPSFIKLQRIDVNKANGRSLNMLGAYVKGISYAASEA